MLSLDAQECGPTVIPTLRSAIKWVCSRLVISCPNLEEPAILALQQEVITKRADTLKEAIPIPIKAIGCLEESVLDESVPDASRIFIWWWLCLVFASLRFDDGKHVKPSEFRMQNSGLFGLAWQTKVDRKRPGDAVRDSPHGIPPVHMAPGGLGLVQARRARARFLGPRTQ